MARSGLSAGEPPSRQPVSGRDRKTAWGLVALGMAGHVLRSRRFYEGVAVAVIILWSLEGIGQESGSGTLARMAAWERREIQRLERRAMRRRRSRTARRRAGGRRRARARRG